MFSDPAPRTAVVAVALLLLVVGAGVAVAATPTVSVFLPEPTLEPGAEQPVELFIQHDGEGAISNVSVTLGDGPFAVTSNTTPLGSVPQGEAITSTHTIAVPSDVEPGTHRLSGAINYTTMDGDTPVRVDDTFNVTATVPNEPRFAVRAPAADLAAGASGTVPIEIENVGAATATDLRATITGGGGVTVGGEAAVEAIGTLEPGETVTVDVDVQIAESAGDGEKSIETEFAWVDEHGIDRSDGPVRGTLAPTASPTISIDTVNSNLAVGHEGELSGTVANEGPVDLRNAVVIVDPAAESLVPAETRIPVGDLPSDANTTFRVPIDVAPDASAGIRDVDVTVEYRSGSATPVRTDPTILSVSVADRPEPAVEDVRADLAVGQDGTLTGEIRNAGDVDLTGAVAIVEPRSASLTPGESRIPLGDLAANEAVPFETTLTVDPDADPGVRDVDVSFEYRSGGEARLTDATTLLLDVADAQSFTVHDVADTLSVGYDGEITGNVSNDGPHAVDDAVLVVEPMSDSLFVEDTRYALPDLAANETTAFTYPTDVSGDANAGPRQVRFTVEYGGADGQTITSDPQSTRVTVDPRTDEFTITGVNTTATTGEMTELVLEITNERPERLSDINAMMFTDSPLTEVADEAYVQSLAPGETARVDFEIRVDGDARETTYPIELDFEYSTERGDTVLSRVYQYPIDVVAADEESGLPLGLLAVVGIIGAGIVVGTMWWRRR